MPTTEMQDARMARLPKWARDRIAQLEASLAYERKRLATGEADSDTIADPYNDPPRLLGTHTQIEFVVKRNSDGSVRDYLQARLQDGGLVVRGSDGIEVHPHASNSIVVKLSRP